MFTRGGVYRVVKEALGGGFAKLSVSALMFDYILTGPDLRCFCRAVHYRPAGRTARCGVAAKHGLLPASMDRQRPCAPVADGLSPQAAWPSVVTVYYWWQNLKGIEESSEKALEVMKITTVMVVILLAWGIFSVFLHRGRKVCRRCRRLRRCTFSPIRSGFLKARFDGAPVRPVFGILMAFGHSVLAMSGEESLAQVNREIEHPKLKNLKRAAIVIAIYSFVFTGMASLLAVMLIPTACASLSTVTT